MSKEEKKEPRVRDYGTTNILFLDISSTCTGWTIANRNDKHEVTIVKAGVLWFDNSWDHGKKYNHLARFVTDIAWTRFQVDTIVSERYMVNLKRPMGTLVIPEATGAVKAACYDNEPPMAFDTISPQTWRAILGIKKDAKMVGDTRYKKPTKDHIDNMFPTLIPQQLTSPFTGAVRKTPYDLYDSLAICIAWFKEPPNSCTIFNLKDKAFE